MSRISKTLLASAAIVVSSSFPAFSQQLAEEVIKEYFAEARANGGTIDPGTMTVSGSTVEWADIVITAPNGLGQMTLPFLRAEEIGGDKVSITYPEMLAMQMDPKAGAGAMTVTINLGDLEHIVSGTAAARRHEYSATRINYKIASEEIGLAMDLTMRDLKSSQINSGTDLRNIKGEISAAGLDLAYSLNDDKINMSTTMTYADITADFDVDVVRNEDMQMLLTGERNMSVNFALGAGKQDTDIKQPEFSGVITALTESSKGSFSVVDGIFKMLGGSETISYDLKFSELPLPPFQAEIDSVAIKMEMPLKKTDGTLPVNFLMNFTGLKASDTIWGMVDPTGSLPRDKATLNIDLTANMKWLVDLVELKNAAGMPAEVQDVTINNITLDVAGARLEGQGSAVLDNSKFPPEPIGAVDLDLKGGVGLLDKLVALGLVPQEQGQMVKMFSGMFAVPGGGGGDHLTSKIEMKEGGSILVNGQQVK